MNNMRELNFEKAQGPNFNKLHVGRELVANHLHHEDDLSLLNVTRKNFLMTLVNPTSSCVKPAVDDRIVQMELNAVVFAGMALRAIRDHGRNITKVNMVSNAMIVMSAEVQWKDHDVKGVSEQAFKDNDWVTEPLHGNASDPYLTSSLMEYYKLEYAKIHRCIIDNIEQRRRAVDDGVFLCPVTGSHECSLSKSITSLCTACESEFISEQSTTCRLCNIRQCSVCSHLRYGVGWREDVVSPHDVTKELPESKSITMIGDEGENTEASAYEYCKGVDVNLIQGKHTIKSKGTSVGDIIINRDRSKRFSYKPSPVEKVIVSSSEKKILRLMFITKILVKEKRNNMHSAFANFPSVYKRDLLRCSLPIVKNIFEGPYQPTVSVADKYIALWKKISSKDYLLHAAFMLLRANKIRRVRVATSQHKYEMIGMTVLLKILFVCYAEDLTDRVKVFNLRLEEPSHDFMMSKELRKQYEYSRASNQLSSIILHACIASSALTDALSHISETDRRFSKNLAMVAIEEIFVNEVTKLERTGLVYWYTVLWGRATKRSGMKGDLLLGLLSLFAEARDKKLCLYTNQRNEKVIVTEKQVLQDLMFIHAVHLSDALETLLFPRQKAMKETHNRVNDHYVLRHIEEEVLPELIPSSEESEDEEEAILSDFSLTDTSDHEEEGIISDFSPTEANDHIKFKTKQCVREQIQQKPLMMKAVSVTVSVCDAGVFAVNELVSALESSIAQHQHQITQSLFTTISAVKGTENLVQELTYDLEWLIIDEVVAVSELALYHITMLDEVINHSMADSVAAVIQATFMQASAIDSLADQSIAYCAVKHTEKIVERVVAQSMAAHFDMMDQIRNSTLNEISLMIDETQLLSRNAFERTKKYVFGSVKVDEEKLTVLPNPTIMTNVFGSSFSDKICKTGSPIEIILLEGNCQYVRKIEEKPAESAIKDESEWISSESENKLISQQQEQLELFTQKPLDELQKIRKPSKLLSALIEETAGNIFIKKAILSDSDLQYVHAVGITNKKINEIGDDLLRMKLVRSRMIRRMEKETLEDTAKVGLHKLIDRNRILRLMKKQMEALQSVTKRSEELRLITRECELSCFDVKCAIGCTREASPFKKRLSEDDADSERQLSNSRFDKRKLTSGIIKEVLGVNMMPETELIKNMRNYLMENENMN